MYCTYMTYMYMQDTRGACAHYFANCLKIRRDCNPLTCELRFVSFEHPVQKHQVVKVVGVVWHI